MAENKIDWRKTVDEYIKFKGSSSEFCKNRNITKGQLFYYKKKFLDEETVFCPININDRKIENENLSTSKNLVNIEIGNAKISLPAGETSLVTSIIKELINIC